jgi:hypothetical protein
VVSHTSLDCRSIPYAPLKEEKPKPRSETLARRLSKNAKKVALLPWCSFVLALASLSSSFRYRSII